MLLGLINVLFIVFQEPGIEAEIKKFMLKYSNDFEMFSKINVNGSNAPPLFQFLKDKQKGTFGK